MSDDEEFLMQMAEDSADAEELREEVARLQSENARLRSLLEEWVDTMHFPRCNEILYPFDDYNCNCDELLAIKDKING